MLKSYIYNLWCFIFSSCQIGWNQRSCSNPRWDFIQFGAVWIAWHQMSIRWTAASFVMNCSIRGKCFLLWSFCPRNSRWIKWPNSRKISGPCRHRTQQRSKKQRRTTKSGEWSSFPSKLRWFFIPTWIQRSDQRAFVKRAIIRPE